MNESQIQRAVFANLRQRGAKGVFAFHPINGGIHQKGRRRGINSALGVVSGTPDVIAIHKGRVYAIELKTETGRPTEAQLAALGAIEKAGGYTSLAYGLDAALRALELWGLLKGKAA